MGRSTKQLLSDIQYMLEYIRKYGEVGYSELIQQTAGKMGTPTMAKNTLQILLEAGRIEKAKRGIYRITESGSELLKELKENPHRRKINITDKIAEGGITFNKEGKMQGYIKTRKEITIETPTF